MYVSSVLRKKRLSSLKQESFQLSKVGKIVLKGTLVIGVVVNFALRKTALPRMSNASG